MWQVVATAEVDAWFMALDESAQDDVRYAVGLLRHGGPQLGRPYVDTLNGSRYANMKELRVGARGAAIRIAFAFDPDRQAVLLVAGDKRGANEKRFYRQLITKADALYAQYLKSR